MAVVVTGEECSQGRIVHRRCSQGRNGYRRGMFTGEECSQWRNHGARHDARTRLSVALDAFPRDGLDRRLQLAIDLKGVKKGCEWEGCEWEGCEWEGFEGRVVNVDSIEGSSLPLT
eukprot:scaffold10951_cov88-Isochrysis_galbana.AAC.1